MSLKKQVASGIFWTFSQQFGSQIINFGSSIILARLLLPSDFGVIALFMVFIAIGNSLTDGGLTSSLIRTKDADDADFSTVFYFNIICSFLIYPIFYFGAPLIADFYKLDILIPVVRIYSLVIIISSFCSVQRTIYTKKMDFKTQFKIQIPVLIIGCLLAIFLAYKGYGVWALVISGLFNSIFECVQYWIYSSWRPKWLFDKKKFKYHFTFGYKITLSGLINTIFNNIYTIIIGKTFNVSTLAYYNRADSLKQLPVTNISTALNKVTLPLFAQIQDDNVQLKNVYKKIMKLVIFIIAPILTLIAAFAEPLIRFLLTEKWLLTAPFLQILCISGLLYPIHAYNLNVLQVKGRSDLFLKLEIIKKIIIVLTIIISFRFGIYGLLWGQVCSSIIAFFINSYYTGKFLNYPSIQQIRDLIPTIFIAVGLGAFIYYVDDTFFKTLNDLFRLIIGGTLYVLLYFSTTYLLKFSEISFINNLIRRK